MTRSEYIEWVLRIKEKLPFFMQQMQGKRKKGFYKYSFSGDLYGENFNWGLGNSVFALKIYYTIGMQPKNLESIIDYIKYFQNKKGEFYDPIVKYTSLPMRLYFAIKEQDKNRLSHQLIRMAETRQCISALKLFEHHPNHEYLNYPRTKKDIKQFINSLKWQAPWGAGAQFSGLMFLLSVSSSENKAELIDYSAKLIKELQQKDGTWYKGQPSLAQKINGAMKIITGLNAAIKITGYNNGILKLDYPKQLIDLSLKAINDAHACDNFNLVYVMRYALEQLNSNYRINEIEKFIEKRLDIFREYYFPQFGAFSFNKNGANKHYYNAILTKGRKEPDIHGTVMFLWGLSVIGNIWDTNGITGLREFTT